jgi:hypothetical protein
MADDQWVQVTEVPGSLAAEIIKGLLEANEIQVMVSQESAGRVYGLTVGGLGGAQIFVPQSQLERAELIVNDYYAGKFNVVTAEDYSPEKIAHHLWLHGVDAYLVDDLPLEGSTVVETSVSHLLVEEQDLERAEAFIAEYFHRLDQSEVDFEEDLETPPDSE